MKSILNEIEDLKKGFSILNIRYSPQIITQFEKFTEILYQYKNKIHLISNADYNRISLRHFLPSLLALPFIENVNTACDIGAGAGFPSVPIKILRPEINFILFESTKKKVIFLEYLIDQLSLTGIEAIAERAENYKNKKFDLILIRAAGKINRLIKIIDPLIKHDSKAILYKSPNVEDEITAAKNEIEKRNFLIKIEKVVTPIENHPMALVILKKILVY